MVDVEHRNPPASDPLYPLEAMPGRNISDKNEAARISNMIDEELKVRSLARPFHYVTDRMLVE